MTKEQAIQEQLYRTRPATTNPKQDGYYVVVDPENIHLSQSFYFMEGDWFEDEIEARENENHDALDVDGCFWLEPIDIDKVVDEVKELNPFPKVNSMDERIAWSRCCEKFKELLNQSK